MQEKEFIAETQIAKRDYRAYDRSSPQKAYKNLLTLLKEKNVRVSKKSFFIVRKIDYDPSHVTISWMYGDYGVSGKKDEIESLLNMAA